MIILKYNFKSPVFFIKTATAFYVEDITLENGLAEGSKNCHFATTASTISSQAGTQ